MMKDNEKSLSFKDHLQSMLNKDDKYRHHIVLQLKEIQNYTFFPNKNMENFDFVALC